MNILSLLGSKASMAIIGVLLVGGIWGGMKLKVWKLESQLAKAQANNSKIQVRERVCKSDLSEMRLSFFRQNERIDRMHEEAAALTISANQAALQVIASPEEIERVLQAPPGHREMNRFMAELLKGGN